MNFMTLILIGLGLTLLAPIILIKLSDEPLLGATAFIVCGLATMYLCTIYLSIEDNTSSYIPYEINTYATTGEYKISAGRYYTDISFEYMNDGEIIHSGDHVNNIAFTENDKPSYVIERKCEVFGSQIVATDLHINETDYTQAMTEYVTGSDSILTLT